MFVEAEESLEQTGGRLLGREHVVKPSEQMDKGKQDEPAGAARLFVALFNACST
jgi:hypothetical protein